MSLQTWRQYGGKQIMPSLNNISAHTLTVDKITVRENYVGLFSVNGEIDVSKDLNVSGNLQLNRNAVIDGDLLLAGNATIDGITQFLGDVNAYGNIIANKDMTVFGATSLNGNMNVKGGLQLSDDLKTDGNVVIGKKMIFDSTNKYITANTNGVGINTTTPQSGLDIYTDISSGFSIYSSQPINTNVLAQNGQHYGILATTNNTASSFQFFNDTPLLSGLPGAKIQYSNGGEFEIDTSNTTFFSGLVVSEDKNRRGHFLNETAIVYDVSNGLFMSERFQGLSPNKGQAMTLMATDTSSITFLNWTTPEKKGVSMGGGNYPVDNTRSMGIVGWTDVSSQFIPTWNVVSGNAAVLNRSTMGINTITNRTENYVLDINGPVHLTHEQIAKTVVSGFEIKNSLFGDTTGVGIAIGSPSTDSNANYVQNILITTDGGQKWNISHNLASSKSDIEYNMHYLTGTAFKNFIFVSAYDPTGGETSGFLFYSPDNGKRWSEISNFIKNGSNLNSAANVIGLSSVYLSITNRIRVFIIYKTPNIVLTYFDIPADDNGKLSGQTTPILTFGSSGNYNYDNYLDSQSYTLDSSFVNDISLYDITNISYGTVFTDVKIVKTSNQGYVYLVGTTNVGSKILWANSTFNNTSYREFSSVSFFGLAVGNNDNAVAVGKNTGTNVGVIYYTNTGTSNSIWSQSTIHGLSGSTPVINDVYVLNEKQGFAVGNNGLLLYCNGGFSDWYVVPQDWLRCFGNTAVFASKNWSGVSMSNSSTLILTASINSYSSGTVGSRVGTSEQFIFYWPNLFGITTNDLLDISGNIRMDGFLRIGNTSENSIQTTGGINTGGNIVVQGNVSVLNNLEVRGNLVLNKDIVLSGNLLVSNTKIVVARSPDSGEGTGAIAIGDNAGEFSQNGFAIAIGSNSGQSNQGVEAISIGHLSGQSNQGAGAIAIGTNSGNTQQGVNSVSVGTQSGVKNQGNGSIAMGYYAGYTGQGQSSIGIGYYAAKQYQGIQSMAIGQNAGWNQQGDGALALGINAGYAQQGAQSIAVGNHSGENQQGKWSVAFGINAGNAQQGIETVAIGYNSGNAQQGDRSISVGYYAGCNQQGGNSVAIGETAAKNSQGGNAIAIGTQAGMGVQGDYSIAVGFNAGGVQQNVSSIAIGQQAGTGQQGGNAISIGTFSGNVSQSGNAIAIGTFAGKYSQGNYSISIGYQSGQTWQRDNSIAVGQNAGQTSQLGYSVAIGYYAAAIMQGQKSVAIGNYSGNTAQGQNAVAVGTQTGQTQQGDNSVAVGNQAGQTQQGVQSVAVGYLSGQGTQGAYSVAIGVKAGQTKQGATSIAIGQNAGSFTQGGNAIAIGYYAGNVSQGGNSVAIGNQAGQISQGINSVAIGYKVGQTNQFGNSVAIGQNISVSSENAIVINSLSGSLTGNQPGFFVKPVRTSTDTNLLYYNTTSGEIRYADLTAYNLGIGATTITASQRIFAAAGITSTTDVSANGGITTTRLISALDVSANGGITTKTLTSYSDISSNGIIYANALRTTLDISANGGITTKTLTSYSDISSNGIIYANALRTTLDISANGGITVTTIKAYSDISSNGNVIAFGNVISTGLKLMNPPSKISETQILYYDPVSSVVKQGAVPASINLNPYTTGDINATGGSIYVNNVLESFYTGAQNGGTKYAKIYTNGNVITTGEIITSAGNIFVNNNTSTIYTGAQNLAGTTYARLYTNGKINATGQIQGLSFNATSDRRLKDEIAPLGTILEKINLLEPVEYKWKKTGDKDFGFIAQDYYRVFPDLAPKELRELEEEPTDEFGNPKYYTLDYGKITCFLTKAVQELVQQRGETGFHGRSAIPENEKSVSVNISGWNKNMKYVVQLTPINGYRELSSGTVENGQFTAFGEPGEFYWSVFSET